MKQTIAFIEMKGWGQRMVATMSDRKIRAGWSPRVVFREGDHLDAKVERVVFNALATRMRLCRLIFAPLGGWFLASSSGEADPPQCSRPNGSITHGHSSDFAHKPAATGFCRM
jgi:hypothetical protein